MKHKQQQKNSNKTLKHIKRKQLVRFSKRDIFRCSPEQISFRKCLLPDFHTLYFPAICSQWFGVGPSVFVHEHLVTSKEPRIERAPLHNVCSPLIFSRPTDRPSDRPSDRETERPTDRASDRATDRPSDRPSDRPTDRHERVLEGPSPLKM